MAKVKRTYSFKAPCGGFKMDISYNKGEYKVNLKKENNSSCRPLYSTLAKIIETGLTGEDEAIMAILKNSSQSCSGKKSCFCYISEILEKFDKSSMHAQAIYNNHIH